MKFDEFKLERFFALHEFNVRCSISSSDCETLKVTELLELAGSDMKQKWHGLDLGYTQSKGHPLLLQEISRLYDKVAPEQVISVAPQEGVFIALSSILERGDHVIVMSPAYQSLSEVPKALGCEVSEFKLEIHNGKWSLDLELLKSMIKKETRLIVVNFPHNPTGYLPTLMEFTEIISIARENGIFVFSDEMYRLLEYDESDRLPPMACAYEKGVSLSGLSKAFGLPGLRTGWLVTQDMELFRQFTIQRDYTTICSSAPGEILAIMALQAKDDILKRILGIVHTNITAAMDFFDRHEEVLGWIPPVAGSVAVGELKQIKDAEQFCNDLIHKKSLLVLPGYVFNFNRNFFRIGLGRRDFKSGLDLLDEYLA